MKFIYLILIFSLLFVSISCLRCNKSAVIVSENDVHSSIIPSHFQKFETVTCHHDPPEEIDYCFAGQFWYKNQNGMIQSLFVKDCANNVKNILESIIPDSHQHVDIDCHIDLPVGKNLTQISYAYDCCNNKNCEIPAFNNVVNYSSANKNGLGYCIIFSLIYLMIFPIIRII